jgi:hypothetical protein
MKPNAFTARPDLTKFLKQARVSESSSRLGKKVSENPTPEQRALMFAVITPSVTKKK